ncbi:hypothetical protein HANVADRAFT_90531 [Hanseniaspora valbyensis NRRL Y-1626]|uniref:Uncharacterized protein n=1 Tax=Hanseniaspora valbyensis NRRL Y-1626 TaxID=766949 RepID=A0A1B7TB81_9ASCO|nr:hypothetical protein HANVADRAFT_90531 [Hanseniaspora valbyensis NRRL Y-1626]
MFDPILDSIKENDKQLKEQQHIQLTTHSQEQKPKNGGYVKDSGDETSSDIPERIDIQNEQIRSGYGLNNGNNNNTTQEYYEEEISDDEENSNNFKIENNSCVNYTDYYDPKHIINVTNTKSKNNFKKQLNKEITVKLNNLYKDKTIDQLIYDLGETQRIAYKLRTGSSNYMKLFDKHEVNYVALTSGKFGGRTKKNPKINDSVLGFQTDMVKLFRMNKKLLLKRASRMLAEKDLINKE